MAGTNPNKETCLFADQNDNAMIGNQQSNVADVSEAVAAGDVGTAADIATEINVSRAGINAILQILANHGLMSDS